MANELVAYSRAGDAFHYRWAARRCLQLIYPNSPLRSIVIEGSSEDEKAGEYVIDVTEYSESSTAKKKIDYYQLKHTTVQKDEPFNLSDLSNTFEGFAKRFIQHRNNNDKSEVCFSIVTNRKFSDTFKRNFATIIEEKIVDKVFKATLEKYTGLDSKDLLEFCKAIRIEDSEGNYIVQEQELQFELSQLLVGIDDNFEIVKIVKLVESKALPDADGNVIDGKINKEEVLARFGFTSELQLYPAPPVWDRLVNIIDRRQNSFFKDQILNASAPVIIYAAGGVGKSVFCRQVLGSLSDGSFGIVYDCFGAGKYRNPSEPRHGHRHALVQIANELAAKGLCNPLLAQDIALNENILRHFLVRIKTAVSNLRKVEPQALLVILIDAADNAEMAAKEFNQSCFAHELLRVEVPEGCKIALLCRPGPGRIDLLQPNSRTLKFELEPFSETESLEHLKKYFPDASVTDGIEFHRLTNRNPRVQANALAYNYTSINALLTSLGPFGTTVEEQIELQLKTAVLKLKDNLPLEYHSSIDEICIGLASLPPHIPLEVLSRATNIDLEEIKSFVADFGRALWILDASVQFRDEPTETWFRKTFLASKSNFENYIAKLEPLAKEFSYIAEVLPQLYLRAEQYDKLITVALSDEHLPIANPIDARSIRVFRLQFAFQAALRAQQYRDAIKLALRAGEEVAGNQRQISLLQDNIHLLISLQNKEKVQEIAFKRLLKGNWDGSENVYTASLLSAIKEYHGEARGYLRSALNWMVMYFEERQNSHDRFRGMDVTDGDLLELTYAHYNIHGIGKAVEFLKRFRSKTWIFNIVKAFAQRIIDVGDFKALDEFFEHSKYEPYFIVAASSELLEVGRFSDRPVTETCLTQLCSKRGRITKPQHSLEDKITPAIVAFAEVCFHWKLSSKLILRVLKHYVPSKVTHLLVDSYFQKERTPFLKAFAIRTLISGKFEASTLR